MAKRPETPVEPPSTTSLLGGFARGLAWTYVGLVLTGASTFFLAAWAVRRIGTAEYGLYALITSWTALLVICHYAIGFSVVRASARVDANLPSLDGVEDRQIVHAAHGAFAWMGALAMAVTVVACGAVIVTGSGSDSYLLVTILLLGLATSLDVGTAAIPSVARGHRQFSLLTAATLVSVVVRVGVALATINRFGVAGLAFAQVVGVLAERMMLARLLHTRVGWFELRARNPDRRALRLVTAMAVPLVVLNLGAPLFNLIDLVTIGAFVDRSAVGVYQIASLLPVYVISILFVGYTVVFPSLSGSDDAADQESATMFLTRIFSYVAGTGFMLALWLRRDIIVVLLGEPSGWAESVLVISAAACLADMFVHGMATLLIVRGRQKLMARAVAIQIPVNLALTIVLVAAFGAVGAAVGKLATLLLLDFIVFPIISRGEFGQSALSATLRHGMVPAAAGAAVATVAGAAAMQMGSPVERFATAAVVGGTLAVAAGLVLLGSEGRKSLRGAFAKHVATVAHRTEAATL